MGKSRRQGPRPITLVEAKALLRPLDVILSKDPEYGEYRVRIRNSHPNTAYFTDDLQDAVATGKAMYAENQRLRSL